MNDPKPIPKYLFYKGLSSASSGPLKESSPAILEEEQSLHGVTRLSLYVLKSGISIWSDVDNTSQILTKDEHFLALNFHAAEIDHGMLYTNGKAVASRRLFRYGEKVHNHIIDVVAVDTSFREGDLRLIEEKKDLFLQAEGLNMAIFSEIFPSLHDINDLFTFLQKKGIAFDPAALARI